MGVNKKYSLLSFSLCDFFNFPLLSLRHFSTFSTKTPVHFLTSRRRIRIQIHIK